MLNILAWAPFYLLALYGYALVCWEIPFAVTENKKEALKSIIIIHVILGLFAWFGWALHYLINN